MCDVNFATSGLFHFRKKKKCAGNEKKIKTQEFGIITMDFEISWDFYCENKTRMGNEGSRRVKK